MSSLWTCIVQSEVRKYTRTLNTSANLTDRWIKCYLVDWSDCQNCCFNDQDLGLGLSSGLDFVPGAQINQCLNVITDLGLMQINHSDVSTSTGHLWPPPCPDGGFLLVHRYCSRLFLRLWDVFVSLTKAWCQKLVRFRLLHEPVKTHFKSYLKSGLELLLSFYCLIFTPPIKHLNLICVQEAIHLTSSVCVWCWTQLVTAAAAS